MKALSNQCLVLDFLGPSEDSYEICLRTLLRGRKQNAFINWLLSLPEQENLLGQYLPQDGAEHS